ncbi:hypothetical protein [Terasakiella sp.]|uniref:Gfo/Idh/MocA family protein n=1 Tax=Terasakiella sp. TaxID=2034861 RepID=UPI003AA9A79C
MTGDNHNIFRHLTEGLQNFQPDLCIIANDTADHAASLLEIRAYSENIRILVEKPLFNMPQKGAISHTDNIFVAYNLRFLPIIQNLKRQVSTKNISSVDIYCGSYLPNWRPETDYRCSYSASSIRGGGVLWDLSHEIDYAQWLFGDLSLISSLCGTFSTLEIDSDDTALILANSPRCPAISIRLNYTDQIAKRHIEVLSSDETLYANLINGKMSINGEIQEFQQNIQHTYLMQAKALLQDHPDINTCTYENGLKTTAFILRAKELSNDQQNQTNL